MNVAARCSSARVPTAAEKLGDFSGSLTGAVPRDPATCRQEPDPTPRNQIALSSSAIRSPVIAFRRIGSARQDSRS